MVELNVEPLRKSKTGCVGKAAKDGSLPLHTMVHVHVRWDLPTHGPHTWTALDLCMS